MRSISQSHVSVFSHELALERIRRKLLLLDRWVDDKRIPWQETEDGKALRDEGGEQVLEWFPRNVVAFARWTGAQNSAPTRRAITELGGFESFGRSTLDRASELKVSVLRALREVQLLGSIQVESSHTSAVIRALTLAADAERSRKQETQRLYVGALAKIGALECELRNEQRLRAADVERLTQELNAARIENARLVARIREYAAIHLAGGTDV